MAPPTLNREARIHSRGSWPGPVVLRAGWGRAHARPANDDGVEASLRLERGSSPFLAACARWLFDEGATAVMSAPLHRDNRRPWDAAGFRPFRDLILMERDLSFPIEAPALAVRPGTAADWAAAADIDRAAFATEWQLGQAGLADAASSTPRSRFLATGEGSETDGFAIVGVAHGTAYLQRMAVRPERRGAGVGRSLLREALRWANRRGARTMLLNTQPDNDGAIALYRSERFDPLPERLAILISRAGER